jgi:predicted dehydrogenase
VLNVGGTYESAMRWLGPGNRVMAQTRVHIPTRRDGQGQQRAATIPDHVEVLYELANGAPVHMKFSETTGLSPGNQIWIFGSEGTIFVDSEQKIFVGKRSDQALAELPNPREQQAAHRVEEEFINAIRGREQVSMTTFETGVRYMEWTEAIHRSAASGTTITLPLAYVGRGVRAWWLYSASFTAFGHGRIYSPVGWVGAVHGAHAAERPSSHH